MPEAAFQDLIPGIHCFGCGPDNEEGLRIKSYWSGPDQASCRYMPQPHQCSGPRQFLNGGIIATVIDCHTICTAVADAYHQAGLAVGEGEMIAYATGSLTVNYLAPVPIDKPVDLVATVTERSEKKTLLECSLSSDGVECATASIVAVRVPASWGRAD